MFRQIARDHVVDPRGLARRFSQAEGIDPFINVTPQVLGPFPRGGGVPLRPAPDGHPPLPPGDPVVEGEGPVPRGVDGHREPAHISVEDLVIPPQVLGLPDGFLVQFQPVDHGSLPICASDMRRRFAPISSKAWRQDRNSGRDRN